ncbi:MAG: histidine phosphatase family protein [Deltaproteobacteria bacterium]|nr:histidine phosphatase family protein [Deltaproteobacteria bacterium]
MKIYLVCHAKAEKRNGWDGPMALRPLTPVGLEQARALAVELASEHIPHVIASPHLRCRQTVEPLAKLWATQLTHDDRLAEGEPGAKALALLDELDDRPTLLCSHGDVIAALMGELEERGVRIDGPFRCEKASVWVIEQDRKKARARYRPPPEREQVLDSAPSDRIGVLDMGSTSFRLLVADVTRSGRLAPVATDKVMLRLGAAVAQHGEIPPALADRVLESARDFGRTAQFAGVDRLFPVGTAALRDATNGRWLSERIGIALGTPVRVLEGVEEARLANAAYRRRVLMGPGLALGADLGGGSMQLCLSDEDGPHWATSFPIGVTRLHREFVADDPMSPEAVVDIRARVREALERAQPPVAWPRRCVLGGGTARAVAKLALARRGKSDGAPTNELEITRTALAGLADDLVRSRQEERVAMPGMHKQRVDLLAAGALILSTAAETLGLDEYVVCDWGLREGVMLSVRDGQLTIP